jgi:predicted DNA binding CopG/RHH family protein
MTARRQRRTRYDRHISVRLPDPLVVELKAEAAAEGRTLRDYIRWLLVNSAAARIVASGELATVANG